MSRSLEIIDRKNYPKAVLDILVDVLKVSDISPEDDFFELGGTSLSAAIVASRIEEELAIEFPVSEIFSDPRIRNILESLKGNSTIDSARNK